jgi:hypothetical protein
VPLIYIPKNEGGGLIESWICERNLQGSPLTQQTLAPHVAFPSIIAKKKNVNKKKKKRH